MYFQHSVVSNIPSNISNHCLIVDLTMKRSICYFLNPRTAVLCAATRW